MRESDINKSWTVVRVLAGLGALPCTIWTVVIIRGQIQYHLEVQRGFDFQSCINLLGGPFGAAITLAGLLCWWFVIRGYNTISRQRIGYSFLGGVILGAIGFIAGFFGPLIFTPTNNLGPLLGIFLTGPLGFVAGVLIGALYALFRVRPSQSIQ